MPAPLPYGGETLVGGPRSAPIGAPHLPATSRGRGQATVVLLGETGRAASATAAVDALGSHDDARRCHSHRGPRERQAGQIDDVGTNDPRIEGHQQDVLAKPDVGVAVGNRIQLPKQRLRQGVVGHGGIERLVERPEAAGWQPCSVRARPPGQFPAR
jgi:hypothetical protein